jgi:hypothetical protein
MRNYETRHIFMVLAFAILLLSPLFVLLLPSFVANSLYITTETWYVFVSGTSYIVYSVGFLFIFLSLLIIFLLNRSKTSLYISLVCILLAGASFYVAAQNYTSLAYDSISYREIFTKEKHTYAWDEIEKVVYNEVPRDENFSNYEFYFNDGEKLILVENGLVEALRGFIKSSLTNKGIQMEIIRSDRR